MIKETIASAMATSAAVLLVSAGVIGAAEPWKGCALALVSLVFGLFALGVIEED